MRDNKMKKTIWDEMRRAQRRINRLWRGFDENPWEEINEEDLSEYRRPWVDAREMENEFIIAIELPGVNKEEIEVIAENGSLVLKVEKKSEEKEEKEGEFKYERSYAGFYRRIPLPENADAEKIDAEYNQGVLKLRIPKKKKTERNGKEIKIK